MISGFNSNLNNKKKNSDQSKMIFIICDFLFFLV